MVHDTDPAKVLQAFVARFPTQVQAARALGISPSYLTDLLHGRRPWSAPVLAALGLRYAVVPVDRPAKARA